MVVQSSCKNESKVGNELVFGFGAVVMEMLTLDTDSEMERVSGIEPPSSAWEAEVIPLYDTRFLLLCPNLNSPIGS